MLFLLSTEYQGGGSSGGNSPVGVCSACKSTTSLGEPEWRKDLCNAMRAGSATRARARRRCDHAAQTQGEDAGVGTRRQLGARM